MIGERVRRCGFWALDTLRGGRLRRSYNEIKTMNESPSSPEVIALRDGYLNQLLSHAVTTTDYYAPYSGFTSLQDFPVMTKQTISDQLEAHLSQLYRKEELHFHTTSGSTGTPFVIYQDTQKRLRHSAENIYFFENLGQYVGDRLYYLRVWNSINKKSSLRTRLENMQMVELSDLSEEKMRQTLCQISEDKSPKVLLAYASTLEAMALSAHLKQLKNAHVKGILTMSEALSDGARHRLEEAFGCPVVSRYSNMECGFMANQLVGKGLDYYVNTASYVVEVLQMENDRPAAVGERGRIVVTDLFNKAMPFIRYDTGDIAVYNKGTDNGVATLSHVEGRRTDFIYTTTGELLSPHALSITMWKHNDTIAQFQFIQQEEKEYLIKLNCRTPFAHEEALKTDCRYYLGADANITIEYVDEIPLLSSGKRKKIVNNYKKV